jgi:hypothetical protein
MKKIPNTKHQTPNNLQIPNTQWDATVDFRLPTWSGAHERLVFESWCLSGVWCLEVGVYFS